MSLTQTLDADGILTLTLDMPNRSANVLNAELVLPFIDAIAQIKSDASIKGVILTSAKKDFLVGADIDKVFAVTDPADAVKIDARF